MPAAYTCPGYQGGNMFTVVCLITAATVLVIYLAWYARQPGAPPAPVALLLGRVDRAGLGELRGVLSVQHQWRVAHNRNSDTYSDTLTVTINHRDRNDLHSSEL